MNNMITPTEHAKLTLQAAGYVVVKSTSYRNAQERQRIAEALKRAAEEDRDSTRRWAEQAFAEQRRLSDRLTFVYGVARAHGASEEELASPAAPTPLLDRTALTSMLRRKLQQQAGMPTFAAEAADEIADEAMALVRPIPTEAELADWLSEIFTAEFGGPTWNTAAAGLLALLNGETDV